ncbi:MAG: hypothetical protein AAF225_06965 [Pseudomonadota bacterium]
MFELFDPSQWANRLKDAVNADADIPCRMKIIDELQSEISLYDLITQMERVQIETGPASFRVALSSAPTPYSRAGLVSQLCPCGRVESLVLSTVKTDWRPKTPDGAGVSFPLGEPTDMSAVPLPAAGPAFLLGLGAFKLTRRRPRRYPPSTNGPHAPRTPSKPIIQQRAVPRKRRAL